MGTSFDEVYLDFQANMTGVNLSGRETLIFQAFLRSVALCQATLIKRLDYFTDKRVFTLRIFDLQDTNGVISLSVNGVEYETDISGVSDERAALEAVLGTLKDDFPLSGISRDTLIIRSENDIHVEINNPSKIAVILQPSYDGRFFANLTQGEISLIATGMTMEWYNMRHSQVQLERANMGTKHFDKDPDRKRLYDAVIERSNYWNSEFMRRRQEFAGFGY